MRNLRVLVAGGGAAGFFAAIEAAVGNSAARVVLAEAARRPLGKVRISGGGRCNVTHACFELRDLVLHYPRGARELLGPFHTWGPRETMEWFEDRGVALKTEEDGRVFPVTDDSATIVDCLMEAAGRAGVTVRLGTPLLGLKGRAAGGFEAVLGTGGAEFYDRVLLATGGLRDGTGTALLEGLGHSVEPPVPSLFTLHIDDARLAGLEGVAVTDAAVVLPQQGLRERGPVLITHWGLSGPAILRLSAWGARELAAAAYRCPLEVSWIGGKEADAIAGLRKAREAHPRKAVVRANPFGLPGRLWERLAVTAGLPAGRIWASLTRPETAALAEHCAGSIFAVEGKSMNKEEFVTCGGVRLSEVDFRTMESRCCPGLHFAGELLDIDGITGGFNFQAAWTTGYLAGRSLARPRG
ncbi:MAG: NAD(P)/FAD-dependent oxidoreductase [Puniceicoccaceae bacterium]|nr:MAG: NAD(P)/FAD-dependent oxidoreductase [Puniceicoccaceae bacterium]